MRREMKNIFNFLSNKKEILILGALCCKQPRNISKAGKTGEPLICM